MKEKNHLNIDLEFLDKKDAPKAKSAPSVEQSTSSQASAPAPVSTGYKYNWKNILIIGGIVLFIGWLMFSDGDSSSNSTNTYTPPAQSSNYNSDGDSVMVGEYSCSRYHYNQAVALNPDETKQQIESAQSALQYRTTRLENLKDEIDNSYVNEYSSQWEIDDYNEKVDEYNSLLPAYKRDVASLDARIDTYNAQIQKHNNYLVANCTKRY
jgi:hypothetical protein